MTQMPAPTPPVSTPPMSNVPVSNVPGPNDDTTAHTGDRWRLIAAGSVFGVAILGALAVLVLWRMFGMTDEAIMPAGRISTSAPAIVIDIDRLRTQFPIPGSLLGNPVTSLAATAADGSVLFVGLGQAEAVDSYLLGSPLALARFRAESSAPGDSAWQVTDVPGTAMPSPPEFAPIWQRSASGRPAVLPVSDVLPATVVIMGEKPKPGLDVVLDVRVKVPGIDIVTAVTAAISGLCLILGLVLLYFALARSSRVGR